MNKITVHDEPTDRTRKNRSEIYEDKVMRAWIEAQQADTNEQTLSEQIELAGNRTPRTQVTETTGKRSRTRESKGCPPLEVAYPHQLPHKTSSHSPRNARESWKTYSRC